MLTSLQASRVFSAVKGNPRDYAMVLLADATGMTPEQISALSVRDFDPGAMEGRITVRTETEGEDGTVSTQIGTVALPMSVRNPLKALAGGKGADTPLFPSTGKRTAGQRMDPKEIRSIINGAMKGIGAEPKAKPKTVPVKEKEPEPVKAAPAQKPIQVHARSPDRIEPQPKPVIRPVKKGQHSLDDFFRFRKPEEGSCHRCAPRPSGGSWPPPRNRSAQS